MKAIILTGGLGTRLRSVVPDTPKPMAPIANRPFLAYLLTYLQRQGFTDIILAVSYRREQISAYFKDSYLGMAITYAIEPTPLGTGGAIRHALCQCNAHEPIFVLNGDTFVTLDYQAMLQKQQSTPGGLTVALREVADGSRYGNVVVDGNVINAFNEKGSAGSALINAGIYLLTATVFMNYALPETFSFEQDFLQACITLIQPKYFLTDNYFIDIGVPEDYLRAQQELLAFQ